ncbi:glycosyltransferase family 2 protein [Flavihumibacter profundi]|uniref:glycosyltransferase family 2 protein n=1 Tax=Flavihumibacter profundi TaxID=2716883 RepID=UPI001CC7D424|nr:glycosyltransferase family 2 protein [Flavihumibacter profundi]MBZ5857995.1 glycosyltransferase family 2 protein [Flavihumibacter profundi]
MHLINNIPQVSILMTSYNREKYIGQAIESVLSSSFEDFELVIVDDDSKDDTVKIANEYASVDSRIIIYKNEHNLGDYKNRNKAAFLARGSYLKYVDADDYIYPWGLEVMVKSMKKFPYAGWGLCNIGQHLTEIYPICLEPKQAYEWHYGSMGIFDRSPLSAIIKKEAFEKIGGFSGKRMVGDFEMWHKLALIYNVVIMPMGLIWYRKHDEQEMNRYFDFIEDYIDISIAYLSDERCPLDPVVANKIIHAKKKGKIRQVIKKIFK